MVSLLAVVDRAADCRAIAQRRPIQPLQRRSVSTPMATSTIPTQSRGDGRSPRRITAKTATSTTLSLSMGATRRGVPCLKRAKVAQPGRARGKRREAQEHKASRRDRARVLPLAHRADHACHDQQDHGGANESGVVGVDAFEADLREDRGERRETGRQERPGDPVLCVRHGEDPSHSDSAAGKTHASNHARHARPGSRMCQPIRSPTTRKTPSSSRSAVAPPL